MYPILSYLNELPDDTEEINVSQKNLTHLPSLDRFTNLQILRCHNNQLSCLPNLPQTLRILNCAYNQLTGLPELPNTLEELYCDCNQLTSLPNLPNTLEKLICDRNQLNSLLVLPNALEELCCRYNQLTSLPNLPNRLEELYCSYNELTSLPVLPNTLKFLGCKGNLLPFRKIEEWNIFNQCKATYYKLKYGSKVERYYMKNIRNKEINQEVIDIVYSPDYGFYKRLLNPDVTKMFAN
jgi:Leucine-rich repeat (LRR) protein